MNWRQRTTCTTYGNSRPVHGAVDPEKPNRTKGQHRVLNHFEPLWSIMIMIHYESHLSSISNPQVDCFLWGCDPQRQESLEELSRRSGWVSKSIRSTYGKSQFLMGKQSISGPSIPYLCYQRIGCLVQAQSSPLMALGKYQLESCGLQWAINGSRIGCRVPPNEDA
jgi:hypothetical protein